MDGKSEISKSEIASVYICLVSRDGRITNLEWGGPLSPWFRLPVKPDFRIMDADAPCVAPGAIKTRMYRLLAQPTFGNIFMYEECD